MSSDYLILEPKVFDLSPFLLFIFVLMIIINNDDGGGDDTDDDGDDDDDNDTAVAAAAVTPAAAAAAAAVGLPHADAVATHSTVYYACLLCPSCLKCKTPTASGHQCISCVPSNARSPACTDDLRHHAEQAVTGTVQVYFMVTCMWHDRVQQRDSRSHLNQRAVDFFARTLTSCPRW